jgi:hypothetical protein
MKTHSILFALGLAAAALLPGQAAAAPLSEGAAHNLCKGWWTHNMTTHTSNCAYCEHVNGHSVCHFFACDQSGCDYIILARRSPKGRWQTLVPRVPRTVR